jgi:hypothetical protein
MYNKIVWLTGMPRSGTNWLSQIFASHPDVRLKFCPLFSYEFKNALDENSSPDEWRELFDKVYHTESEYLDQEYLRNKGYIPKFKIKNEKPSVLVIKSTRFHNLTQSILNKCPEIKWIAIVRNPCASIYSWLSNELEFPTDANPMTEWRTGKCRKTGTGEFWGFDDWKRVSNMFLELNDRYPEQFRILRYEHLVKYALRESESIFSFIGLDFSEQTKIFLEKSQSLHTTHQRSVFKDPSWTERWRDKIDQKIKSQIESEIMDTPLNIFLNK